VQGVALKQAGLMINIKRRREAEAKAKAAAADESKTAGTGAGAASSAAPSGVGVAKKKKIWGVGRGRGRGKKKAGGKHQTMADLRLVTGRYRGLSFSRRCMDAHSMRVYPHQTPNRRNAYPVCPSARLAPSGSHARARVCVLVLVTDVQELDVGGLTSMDWPDSNKLTEMVLTVKPDTGYWEGGSYKFNISVPRDYPHKPPKVTCATKVLSWPVSRRHPRLRLCASPCCCCPCARQIFHPNIDFAGAVCLNILRADWKPVFDLNTVVSGITYLFYEPNADDPLNAGASWSGLLGARA